jgi:hypothetical protein
MVNTKPVLLALLLAVTLPLTGCTALTDGDTDDTDVDDVDGEQLRTATLDAMESVETARFESKMTMEMNGDSFTAETEGEMDLTAEKMHLTTTSSVDGQSFEGENYLVDETMYMHSEMLGGWVKQNMSGMNMWETNQLGQQQQLLEEAELEVTGETTTDGEEVYVTELSVDGTLLNDIASQQTEDGMTQFGSEMSFNNATVTQHIDTETDRVRYTKISYTLSTNGQEMSMTMEQWFSEFDEPVEIELPEEAENAEPISETVGGQSIGT